MLFVLNLVGLCLYLDNNNTNLLSMAPLKALSQHNKFKYCEYKGKAKETLSIPVVRVSHAPEALLACCVPDLHTQRHTSQCSTIQYNALSVYLSRIE